jgi:hypothetical protein
MEFTVNLNVEDYKKASNLHWFFRNWKVKFLNILSLGIVLVVSLLVGYVAFLAFILVVAGVTWSYTKQIKKVFSQTKILSVPHNYKITSDVIEVDTEYSKGKFLWSDLIKWNVNDELIMLYVSDIMFLVFPKRCFNTTDQFKEFEALVQKKLPRA